MTRSKGISKKKIGGFWKTLFSPRTKGSKKKNTPSRPRETPRRQTHPTLPSHRVALQELVRPQNAPNVALQRRAARQPAKDAWQNLLLETGSKYPSKSDWWRDPHPGHFGGGSIKSKKHKKTRKGMRRKTARTRGGKYQSITGSKTAWLSSHNDDYSIETTRQERRDAKRRAEKLRSQIIQIENKLGRQLSPLERRIFTDKRFREDFIRRGQVRKLDPILQYILSKSRPTKMGHGRHGGLKRKSKKHKKTRKGMRRKTARRAYMKRHKSRKH